MSDAFEGIVILGLPRSGTTLLSRLLGAHTQIACPAETFMLTACGRFLKAPVLPNGVSAGVLSGLTMAGFPSDHVLEDLRTFALKYHRRYARERNKKYWAEKTAIDVFYLEQIDQLLGDRVRYVCLQRHGLDVAASLKWYTEQVGEYLPELHPYVRAHTDTALAFAHLWADRASALNDFARAHPNTACTVRYEDLVQKPETILESILDHLDLAAEPDLIQRGLNSDEAQGFGDWKSIATDTIVSDRMARWKKWPPHTLYQAARVCNPLLQSLGYEPVQADPVDLEESLRRYRLSLALHASKRPSDG